MGMSTQVCPGQSAQGLRPDPHNLPSQGPPRLYMAPNGRLTTAKDAYPRASRGHFTRRATTSAGSSALWGCWLVVNLARTAYVLKSPPVVQTIRSARLVGRVADLRNMEPVPGPWTAKSGLHAEQELLPALVSRPARSFIGHDVAQLPYTNTDVGRAGAYAFIARQSELCSARDDYFPDLPPCGSPHRAGSDKLISERARDLNMAQLMGHAMLTAYVRVAVKELGRWERSGRSWTHIGQSAAQAARDPILGATSARSSADASIDALVECLPASMWVVEDVRRTGSTTVYVGI